MKLPSPGSRINWLSHAQQSRRLHVYHVTRMSNPSPSISADNPMHRPLIPDSLSSESTHPTLRNQGLPDFQPHSRLSLIDTGPHPFFSLNIPSY
jgi:hypothetical protein